MFKKMAISQSFFLSVFQTTIGAWLHLQVSRGAGYVQLYLDINPTDACSKDCLGFALTGVFKHEFMVCLGTRLMQGLYGMHVLPRAYKPLVLLILIIWYSIH